MTAAALLLILAILAVAGLWTWIDVDLTGLLLRLAAPLPYVRTFAFAMGCLIATAVTHAPHWPWALGAAGCLAMEVWMIAAGAARHETPAERALRAADTPTAARRARRSN